MLLVHRLLITSEFACCPLSCHTSPLPFSMASPKQAVHAGPIPEAFPFISALVFWGSLAHPEAECRCFLQLCSLLPCLAGASVSSDASCCQSCLPVQHQTRLPASLDEKFGCSSPNCGVQALDAPVLPPAAHGPAASLMHGS